jgi:CCAAT-binding factor, subunit C
MEGSSKRLANKLPVACVNKIIKGAPDVSSVSEEAVFMITKAAEAFIKYMVEQVIDANGNPQTIEYDHVSHLVHTQKKFNFLREMIPRRTTLREIQEQQLQEAIAIGLPEIYAVSDISFCSDDDLEQMKTAPATHETIAIPGSSRSAPESSSSVSR